MLLVIPALIDTTNAAMPARRNINALRMGLWWATNQPPAKGGTLRRSIPSTAMPG
jgi:hypothetical protein